MAEQDAPDGVDLEQLRPWFASNVAGAGDRPLHAELIAGGRSNLTYTISDGDHTWVLRRPPLAHVVATAHDMGREFRVLAALRDGEVPVPKVHALCEDADLIGAPFYVMERVEGRVLRDAAAVATLSSEDSRRCSEQLVDVLARLHSVDYEAVGLGAFGRPDGFLARNVQRWGKQWQANKTRDLPAVDELARRLEAALPTSGPPAIVHGDYRLDNTMLAMDDPGRIVAVLDWEMSTVGDPLTDLGLFLVYSGAGSDVAGVRSVSAVSEATGFLSADDIAKRYGTATGRDVAHLDFYVVFAFYKLAVILEGINARFQMGKTVGEGFDEIGAGVTGLVDAALARADVAADDRLRG